MPKSPADKLRQLEALACDAIEPNASELNPACVLPYGLKPKHVLAAMKEFTNFLSFVNTQLRTRDLARFESMLMPANFSSMVGEFMTANIPKHCAGLVKNRYHNGHPDMLPTGMYSGDAAQHVGEGVEVKASRYPKGWQGHNAEDVWLMVFVFSSSRPNDESKGVLPAPFHFRAVYCAKLKKSDWNFSGRSGTSRRTITASVMPSGFSKMSANWLYRAPDADAAVEDESD